MRGGFLLGVLLMQVAGAVTSLEGLRDKARPLLIFAADEQDARFQQQAALLAADRDGLRERQVLAVALPGTGGVAAHDPRIWGQLSAPEMARARLRFHVGPQEFVVVLIGKDGGEKKRWGRPVPFAELRAVIDAMPGRQDEVRQAAPKSQ